VNRNMYIDILRRLRDAVIRKRPKKWRTRQCSSTPAGFGHIYLSKERYDKTGAFAVLFWQGSSLFSPVHSTEISVEGTALLWYWYHYECAERAEKAFKTRLPETITAPLQMLAKVYSCTRGLFRSKCRLNNCKLNKL